MNWILIKFKALDLVYRVVDSIFQVNTLQLLVNGKHLNLYKKTVGLLFKM
jgi:hypothetical protein